MRSFTEFQKEELICLLGIRQDTVECDPESADPLEAIPGALEALKTKIQTGVMDFTELERDWLIEELETRMQVGYDNIECKAEKMSRMAFIKSMQNAIDKVYSN